jgi:enoyl-CoA hydratase
MNYQTITLTTAPGTQDEEGIRLLTLNRPDVMNAMNTLMFTEMRHALDALAHDAALRVLLLTGAGTRAFSAGGDLKERNGMSDATWRAQKRPFWRSRISPCPPSRLSRAMPMAAAWSWH